MYATHSFQTGLALLKQAIATVAEHADCGAVLPLQDVLAELSDLIDDLPEAIVDAEYDHCGSCKHYNKNIDLVPYGDRIVARDSWECEANGPNDCPAVRRAGLGPDMGVEIPAFLQKQAS